MKQKNQVIHNMRHNTEENGSPTCSGQADYGVALYGVEQKLKIALEELEVLRCAILTQDNDPKDLFSFLAGNGGCKFLSVEDLSKLLNVDRRTIYSLKGQGLPSYRVGKELRFDPLEVSDWLKKREQR